MNAREDAGCGAVGDEIEISRRRQKRRRSNDVEKKMDLDGRRATTKVDRPPRAGETFAFDAHLRGGDIIQLRRATGLALGVGVCGERGVGSASGRARGCDDERKKSAETTVKDAKGWLGFARRARGDRGREDHSLITMMGLCMPCILSGVQTISTPSSRVAFARVRGEQC